MGAAVVFATIVLLLFVGIAPLVAVMILAGCAWLVAMAVAIKRDERRQK